MIGEMVDILVKQFGQQEKNKKKYITGLKTPIGCNIIILQQEKKIKKGFDSMIEIGIFRKELHEMDLINTGNEE